MTQLGPWKIPKCLENRPLQDQKGVKNGLKTRFSKCDPRPFGMLKQVFFARFGPMVTRSGPWKTQKCLEKGPFWEQKRVKNGSKMCSAKSDLGPLEMLKQVFLAHFEPVLTEFSPFSHMYAPNFTLCTFLRALCLYGPMALRYVRRAQLGAYTWRKGLNSVRTGSKWAHFTCLCTPNGP